jgi:hypothetical protein
MRSASMFDLKPFSIKNNHFINDNDGKIIKNGKFQ